jgi:predicted ATP-dependent endonuclease of OLD family
VKKSSDTIANVLNIENKEKFKLIKYELGIKNSDLFFNDFIIFIEGETEEKAIPILFSAVGMTLEESGIYQINIRGVGRLAKIKEFLIYIKNFDMKSFLILDDDDGVKEKIKDLQREGLVTDNFYIWKKGTFLDCFDEHYVIRAMNNLYPNKFDMTEKQLKDEKDKGKSTEKFLTKYLHERELGDLNKPALGEEIALIVKEEINSGKERKETEAEEILKNIFSQFSSNK